MKLDEKFMKQIKPGGLGPINRQRRTFIGGAVAALLASSRPAKADIEGLPNDPFIVLLKGIYQPVPMGEGPGGNLGLTAVNLSSGFYSKTQIYPIFGVDGANDQKKAIGTFYAEATLAQGKITPNPPSNPGDLFAYDLPGGALVMTFLPSDGCTRGF